MRPAAILMFYFCPYQSSRLQGSSISAADRNNVSSCQIIAAWLNDSALNLLKGAEAPVVKDERLIDVRHKSLLVCQKSSFLKLNTMKLRLLFQLNCRLSTLSAQSETWRTSFFEKLFIFISVSWGGLQLQPTAEKQRWAVMMCEPPTCGFSSTTQLFFFNWPDSNTCNSGSCSHQVFWLCVPSVWVLLFSFNRFCSYLGL